MKKILVLGIAALAMNSAEAQNNYPGFTTTANGVKYKIVKHGTGRKAEIGYGAEMHILFRTPDTVIFDSRKMNNDKPVPFTIQKPSFNGDPSEAFLNLSAGDSAVILAPADSMTKMGGKLPWAKPGSYLEYDINVVTMRSPDEQHREDSVRNASQGAIDDKIIQDYLKAKKIKATKTPSGLYYTITKQGSGEKPALGKDVYVNYTGMTTNGKKFDSNVDSAFHHVEPFHFPIGQHHVIAGWDEGIALLNKGAKATLFIPSKMAYGHQGAGANIPPDAVLVFEVELVDIKSPN